ncbi:MAG TPA: hypothetical protein VL326_05950 [Kofleriaceae bacterium]|nr:hypothetical protein [Kofleriaceae bacterium]
MRQLPSALVIVMSLMGSAYAEGDALVDQLGPREIAVGEALRGGATGASAIGLNPSGIPLNRELVFEGGYGYRLADQASLVGVSACDSTSAIPGCFYYSYAGSSPDDAGMSLSRRTHMAGSSIAYPITPRVFLGSSIKYFHFNSDVPGEMKASGFNWDIGTTLRITDLVTIGATGYNLWGADSPEFARALGGGVLARPSTMLAVSFDARWKLDGNDHSARYGGGAELFLSPGNGQSGFPIRAGALRDNGLGTTYLSAGLGYASMKLAIDVAGRFAVTGKDDTMFIASMRFYGPRLRAPALDAAE